MRFDALPLLALCVLISPVMAQQSTPAPPSAPAVYGSVSGHVACVDSNQPARLASVTLQTIDVKPDPVSGSEVRARTMRTYQTALDGSFIIPKVRPGTYYVVIQKPGYLSPITQFTQKELQQPTPETLARILRAVPTVSVEPNHVSTIDTRIERGAEFAGTIRYDDGTPVAETYVTVLTKETRDTKDTWVSNYSGGTTDDLGHYRITGLSPAEYLLQVDLRLTDMYVSNVLGGSRSSSSNSKYSLSFYSGDVTRKDKGSSIKLSAGEQHDGADITIPVSKLHSVSGTITEQRSGHVINAGQVSLAYDDGTELVSTSVDKDDSAFHFDFVPEGEYTLKVKNAKDVAREEIPSAPGTIGPTQSKETTIREYGTQSQPLVVQADSAGIVIAVPGKNAKVAGTQ